MVALNRDSLEGVMAGPENDGKLSLAMEKRHLTEDRILQATMRAMAAGGFSVTVDDIAAIAGVSSRTIYRYFDTHDQLVAAGMRGMLKACESPIPGLPPVDEDLDGWIDRIALASAERNVEIFGAAFWDFARPAPSDPEVIREARALRRPTRIQWMTGIAGMAWTAAGGEGEPPLSLVTTFALALSAFTCHALAADFDFGPEETARFMSLMIKERLSAALDAQRLAMESA
jgi:AcrR family transcriptional regulator